jgi:hypothetical protein
MPFAGPEMALGSRARGKVGLEVIPEKKRAPGAFWRKYPDRLYLWDNAFNDLQIFSTTYRLSTDFFHDLETFPTA